MLDPGSVLLQAALAFITTAGFGMLFNVPRRTLLACGLVGAGGHALRYSLQTLGVSTEVATFAGALFVGLVGYAQARRFHLPRLVFTVTGIITMVPGIPAYEVLVFFSEGDTLGGLQAAVRVALVTGAIAAGLGMARVLVDMEWQHLG